jgi:hypothetical protein
MAARASRPRRRQLQYRLLFPAWSGPHPLHHFFTESLLAARQESQFPTNSDGPDEEVNVYLADLLTGLYRWRPDPECRAGAEPLLRPPANDVPRWRRGDSYRRDGDLRLLGLGLFGRGDLLARRSPPYGFTAAEARERDFQVGSTCYRLAALELDRGTDPPAGLVPVLHRLATRFGEYVHVLEVLARGRFGLGARLSHAALRDLLPPGVRP